MARIQDVKGLREGSSRGKRVLSWGVHFLKKVGEPSEGRGGGRAGGGRQSAVGSRQSAVGSRQSAVGATLPCRLREGRPWCLYRWAGVTAAGAGAYPVGRAVKVPRPWVRLRNRVA